MIQLVGKVTKTTLDLNGKAKLTINQKSGRISLSKKVVDTLNFNLETQSIGFGYDPEKTLGASAFLYVIDNVEEGIKAGKSGSLTSKYHCAELNKMFTAEIGEANRYELDFAEEAKDYNETKLYALTFSTVLNDITRTKKEEVTVTASEPQAEVETPVAQVAEVEVPTVQDNVQEELPETEPENALPWNTQDMMADAEAEAQHNEEPQEESNEPQAFTFGAEG